MPLRRLAAPSSVVLAFLCAVFLAPSCSAVLTDARYAHTTTLLPSGDIMVAGGFGSTNLAIATAEIIFSTGSFAAPLAPMSVARASHTATLLPNGKVLVAGGINAAGTVLSSTELYDPLTNTWTPGPAMSVARMSHTATLLPNGKVLLTSGQDTLTTVTNNCDLYTPPVGPGIGTTAATSNAIAQARSNHTATQLHNGKVLVAGGTIPPFTGPTPGFAVTTELFDPSAGTNGTWSPGPTLIQKRAFHTATQMGDRNVLIVGGFNNNNVEESYGFLGTTEIYNPISNSISPGASMSTRRSYHTAALNPNGRVMINGGLGNITTNFFTQDISFEPESRLYVERLTSIAPSTGFIRGDSDVFVEIDANITPRVTGTINEGQVAFSSTVVVTDDSVIRFTRATATLNGAEIDEGEIRDYIVRLSTPSGTVIGSTVTRAGDSLLSTAVGVGTAITFASPQDSENPPQPASTIGGTLVADVTMTGFDNGLYANVVAAGGGSPIIVRGSVRITAGTITRTGTSTSNGYTLNFTRGTALITEAQNCPITTNADGDAIFTCRLTFNNLGGTIIPTSGTVVGATDNRITSPIDDDDNGKATATQRITGLALDGFSFSTQYVASAINLGAKPELFDFDIATVTIKSMVFETRENYDPDGMPGGQLGNTFEFGELGTRVMQGSATPLPNNDILLAGGRQCTPMAATPRPSGAEYTCQPFRAVSGYSATVMIPSLPENAWTVSGQLSDGRANHTLTVLGDGTALAAGGTNGPSVLNSTERYDPVNRTWSDGGTLRTPRNLHSSTLLTNGNVLATGGFASAAANSEINSAEIYIPAARAWSYTGPMASSRVFHGAALMTDGNVLITGGFGNNQYLSATEIFYSTGLYFKTLSPATAMIERSLHTTTLLKDGRIMVVGGVNASGVINGANSVQAYNPATNTWETLANLPGLGRHSHTATLLIDGSVLVSGGNDGFGEISDAIVWVPSSPTGGAGSWETTTAHGRAGNEMLVKRLKHTALLLPNGKVMVTGGVKANGQALRVSEGYDVFGSTWQDQGRSLIDRGFLASAVLFNGSMLNTGGFTGLVYQNQTEDRHFLEGQDVGGVSQRIPQIVSLDTGTVLNTGQFVTIRGARLRGNTEATGTGAGAANSSSHHPRVYLQRLDGAGASNQAASSFIVDVTSRVYYSRSDPAFWSVIDSSITVALPNSTTQLPFGLYALRVSANGQFSDATVLQVGPKRPTQAPGISTGTLQAAGSSVLWTWPAAAGVFDGYSIYSATSGVFLGTAPAVAEPSFLHTGLGPDNVSLIQVAPFNISGDGPVAVATVPVNTPPGTINNLRGAGTDPSQITWTWDVVPSAVSYDVYSASTGTLLATLTGSPPPNTFIETGLSTNTAFGVRVQALTTAGQGALSGSATAFTLAAVPIANQTAGMIQVTAASFLSQWLPNGNPPLTTYRLRVTRLSDGASQDQSGISITSFTTSGLDPNVVYAASVTAINGDGLPNPAAFANLGSTPTLANVPLNPQVTGTSANSISLSWGANGNSAATVYQVEASSDNFLTSFFPFPFSSGLTSTSATVPNLLGGITYKFRIKARNLNFQETTVALPEPSGTTDNGGGPPGSLVLLVPARSTATASISGQLSDLTRITMSAPADAFEQNTRIFINARTVANACGGRRMLTITTLPADSQPRKPIRLEVGFESADVPFLGALATVGVTRFVPGSGACVPAQSQLNASAQTITAYLNHFSEFQLQQIAPSGTLETGRVFPNPLFKRNQPFFTFSSFPANSRIRVYTLHGELLFDESTNSSGIAIWPATNRVGRQVASGVYLAVIEAGGSKRTFKLAVVR